MSPQKLPDDLPPAPSSLPPDVATPDVAAASAARESEAEITAGVSPVDLPEAGPHADRALPPGASTPRQLFGLLAAPIVWAAQLQTGYSLATMFCTDRHRLLLHLVSLVALAIAAAGALVAWRAWRAIGEAWPADEGGPPGRTRFAAATGTVMSTGFFVIILAQALPSFFFPVCR